MNRAVVLALTVPGLLLLAQASEAANPAVGLWKMNQPGIGESKVEITEKDGKLHAQEIGLGNVTAKTVTYQDGLLVIHWELDENYHGYWELNLNKKNTRGEGKTVFTRYNKKDPPKGVEEKIEGRTVIVLRGVTVERVK